MAKPSSKPQSNKPPPRPANKPERPQMPDCAPSPARPPRPSAPRPNINQSVPTTSAMPDIAQIAEVDLLNLASSARSNNNSNHVPIKAPSFDLLGSFETAEAQGNNAMPDLLSDSKTKPPGLDDIFASFSQPATSANNANLPDLGNTAAPQNKMNYDPFGIDATFVSNVQLLQPTSNETSPSQPQQPTTVPSTSKDPFADLGNLASGLNLDWGSQQSNTATAKTTPVISPQSTQFSSPTHQFGGFTSAQPSVSPMHQAKSPMENQSKPDYNRSHFEAKPKQNGTTTSTAPAGTGGSDIFADILGQQGYNFATKPQGGPRSINDMRKEELVKDMDPDKLRIMEWVRIRCINNT